MKGRSKVRITPNVPSTVQQDKASERDAKESKECKRIRQVKRRADNLRAQANRLITIARDLHSRCCKPRDLTLGRPAHGEDPRDFNIRKASLAFKSQAIDLGYSFVAHHQQNEDAKDGGQQLFEEFLEVDTTGINSCPKLFNLAENFKGIAVSWDQIHVTLAKEELKASHACPKKGSNKCPEP